MRHFLLTLVKTKSLRSRPRKEAESCRRSGENLPPPDVGGYAFPYGNRAGL